MEQPRKARQELSLPEVFHALAADWRKVAAVTAGALLLAVAYIATTPKVYYADSVIRLENVADRRHAETARSLMEAEATFERSTNIPAAIGLIKSRMVLGEAVDQLSMQVISSPVTVPVVGYLVANHLNFPEYPLPEPFRAYGFRNEQLQVGTFDVPEALEDVPFSITIGTGNTFSLADETGRTLGEGRIGELESFPSPVGNVQIQVSGHTSHAGARFELKRRSRDSAIRILRERIIVTEEGRDSGLLRIAMQGENRDFIKAAVGAIATSYISKTNEWRSADIRQALAYLEEELPVLKAETEKADAALRKLRQSRRVVELGAEIERVIDRTVELETQRADLARERSRYMDTHPTARLLDSEIAAFDKQISDLDQRIKGLPLVQQETAELSRIAETNAALYSMVYEKTQELRLLQSSSGRSARLVDDGFVAADPVKPKAALVIAVALVLGLLAGSARAVLRRVWHGVLFAPSDVETLLGIPVYTSLPYARSQRALESKHRRKKLPAVLADYAPSDITVEGLRTLRTWLSTADFRSGNKGLLITGASPGVGKTFISVNLASVLAATGRRVLLIDTDLRRGNLHRQLGVEPSPGLSDLITGHATLSSGTIHSVSNESFSLMPRGTRYSDSSELLLRERFAEILRMAGEEFDDVIIDSPPILAVSDAAIIGRHVGSALLVVREGVNTPDELAEASKRLQQAGVPLRGAVLNGLKTNVSRYFYHYGDYEKVVDT